MKKLIRQKEFEKIYDLIMARENIEIVGGPGCGKSYLVNALKEKLEGRRVCLHLNFENVFTLSQVLENLEVELNRLSVKHPNVAFQVKRFREENPVYLVNDLATLAVYLLKLRDHLSLVGLDFVFILENIERWDLKEPLSEFWPSLKALAESPNSQLLLASSKSWNSDFSFFLNEVEAEEVWENPGEAELKVLNYCRGNIAFLKSWSSQGEGSSEHFFKSRQAQFLMMRSRFTDLQWKLLRAIAHYEIVEQPHAFDFLVKHNLGAASSVERAIRNLLDSGFVEKKEEGYRVASPQMHRWMQYFYYRKSFA